MPAQMIADDPGGCDPGDKRKIGGHRGVRPFPDEEEKDDDYIEYDVHRRSHCIARCVSELYTSPFEEGGIYIDASRLARREATAHHE
jgi:hypothetical protein